MGGIVSSTADILAILGGVTTLMLGIFGAVRLSRCQTVKCCWGCIDLINKPLATGAAGATGATGATGAAGAAGAPNGGPVLPVLPVLPVSQTLQSNGSESDLSLAVI